MKERKKIIAVDFDGTLFEQMEEKDWPTPGAPRQAVIDYVLEQQRQGASRETASSPLLLKNLFQKLFIGGNKNEQSAVEPVGKEIL